MYPKFQEGKKMAKPITGDHRTSAMEHWQGFAATRMRCESGGQEKERGVWLRSGHGHGPPGERAVRDSGSN